MHGVICFSSYHLLVFFPCFCLILFFTLSVRFGCCLIRYPIGMRATYGIQDRWYLILQVHFSSSRRPRKHTHTNIFLRRKKDLDFFSDFFSRNNIVFFFHTWRTSAWRLGGDKKKTIWKVQIVPCRWTITLSKRHLVSVLWKLISPSAGSIASEDGNIFPLESANRFLSSLSLSSFFSLSLCYHLLLRSFPSFLPLP